MSPTFVEDDICVVVVVVVVYSFSFAVSLIRLFGFQ